MELAISAKSFTVLACTARASINSVPPSRSTIKLFSNEARADVFDIVIV